MQIREIPLHGQLMQDGKSRTREIATPGPRRFVRGHLVLHEDPLELLDLVDLLFVVLLADGAPILAGREPHLEPDSALNGAPMTACLQLKPSIQSGGWDFGYRNVHGSQEIVLGTLASRLAHLFEETSQSSNSTDLIQSRDGVHDAAFVVVVPNVQVEGVRIDVINVAVVDRKFLNFTFNFQ